MMSFILFKFCCLIFLLTGSLSKVQSAPQGLDALAYDGGISCGTMFCPEGTICQQENIQCFADPCPQPTLSCVPIRDYNGLSCPTVVCSPGTYCHQDTIYCVRAPCPQPPPECLPCGPYVDFANAGDDLEFGSAFAVNPCLVSG